MKIEEISDRNLDELTNLILELWTNCSFENEFANCKRILKSEFETCFISKVQEEYIGFIYLAIRTDYVEGATASPVTYIEGIYVKPEFRKKGIGKKLVEHGAKWGKQKGCKEYASDTELNNPISEQFHKSVGFKEVKQTINFLKKSVEASWQLAD